ncbi:hypothetical protein HON52_01705 [Candidatus Uhrbacteria bacterium]|jgi:hypothetical protein|nr:hypothetical protein [Candidatus Uhrbacteria bacterium]
MPTDDLKPGGCDPASPEMQADTGPVVPVKLTEDGELSPVIFTNHSPRVKCTGVEPDGDCEVIDGEAAKDHEVWDLVADGTWSPNPVDPNIWDSDATDTPGGEPAVEQLRRHVGTEFHQIPEVPAAPTLYAVTDIDHNDPDDLIQETLDRR